MRQVHKIHCSWLIATVSLFFVVGVHLALYSTAFSSYYWLLAFSIIFFVTLVKRSRISIVTAVVCGLIMGLSRGGAVEVGESQLQKFIGQEVQLWGKIHDDPAIDIDGDIKAKLYDIQDGNRQLSGTIWVSVSPSQDIKRSDFVLVEGVASKGFGIIPVAMYRARVLEHIDGASSDPGRQVRSQILSGIRESIHEPQASLGAGFLLGDKATLSEKVENDLRILGLTHIIVASGYNLTILVRFARKLLLRVSRFSALAGSAGLIMAFLQITGYSPSMSRASVIALLSLSAWYYGRKIHPLVLLPFSAAITVAVTPAYAWGDIGWLLSFLSFIGVIVLAPLLHAYFWGENKPSSVRQVLIETVSAQICTLPLILYVFGAYSVLSPLANVLILPLVSFAMFFVAIAGVGGLIVGGTVAHVVGFPAEVILRYMTYIADKMAQISFANSEVHVSLALVISLYILLITTMIVLKKKTGYALRESSIIE